MSNYEEEINRLQEEFIQDMEFEMREGSPISPRDIFSDDENLEDRDDYEDKDEDF